MSERISSEKKDECCFSFLDDRFDASISTVAVHLVGCFEEVEL